jgi:glycosyltransferase involved in cell wall biosynthesis
VEELSARLAERGHEVTVYCRRHYAPEQPEHRGVRLRFVPCARTKHLEAITHTALALGDAWRQKYDLVHFHSVGPSSLSFIPRYLFRRTGVVATVHALDSRRRKWGAFARWCLRRGEWAAAKFPDRTIVVSRIIQDYYRLRGRTVVHIPNGVEAPQPAPLNELRKLGIQQEGFILWMGRFVPEKRVEDLIRAFSDLRPDTDLVLAGGIDERDEYLARLWTQSGRHPRIRFVGGLYGPAKAEALTNTAVLVLPSELEGFPIALLEAMRYGRPVLASDIPENLEAVQPGVNGFTFRVGDAASLREQMGWILSHPAESAAAAARAAVDAKKYDWDAIVRQTEAVYQDAVRGR